MDQHLLQSVITVTGALGVSLVGSFLGSRFANRTRWADRMADALPKFYAASTIAYYAWQRYAIAVEGTASSGPTHRYYEEHISTYRDLLSTCATLVLLFPPKRRQEIWDLLDLWEGNSDPHSDEHENRSRERSHQLLMTGLELMGKTAPVHQGG